MLVLSCQSDAPWLPPGGRADVVVHEPHDPAPGPVGLVRLLVTDPGDRVFCTPRTGDRPGWDLPTAPVPDGDPQTAVDHDSATVLTTELNVAWGLWLDDVDRDQDRITRSATDALVLGMDSPALRELAGLTPDVVWPDVDLLVRQAAT
ncbi:hypothetical protein [Myceligenerans xiligouense]|uniref:hypothetical protein n=1 Tax=Myceligenerans xiligouense TaxID=253184 RepID=UPI0014769512|nr:hypothetical protein [Myceligenerans xiligouense]